MNSDTIGGNWKQFVGKAREKWGKLTDNDWETLGGQKDQIVGKIQERYGVTRDEAQRQWDEFNTSADHLDSETAHRAKF
jgi:uncharacterized protein YjbJ (UPF0337 family)